MLQFIPIYFRFRVYNTVGQLPLELSLLLLAACALSGRFAPLT